MKCPSHTNENCRPLWRSDLVGPNPRYVHDLPHGWWCVDCGGESHGVAQQGITKLDRAKVQAASWAVRLTRTYEVLASARGTTGAEAHKLCLALQAAERLSEKCRKYQGLLAMGRIGWRATELASGLLVWFWFDTHDHAREGCAVVGVQTKTERQCAICHEKIEPGTHCWRGVKPPFIPGFHAIREHLNEYRACVKCIAQLPREALDTPTSGPLLTGRRMANLRLVKSGGES